MNKVQYVVTMYNPNNDPENFIEIIAVEPTLSDAKKVVEHSARDVFEDKGFWVLPERMKYYEPLSVLGITYTIHKIKRYSID